MTNINSTRRLELYSPSYSVKSKQQQKYVCGVHPEVTKGNSWRPLICSYSLVSLILPQRDTLISLCKFNSNVLHRNQWVKTCSPLRAFLQAIFQL